MQDHPIQPLVKDEHGRIRFKENSLVSKMLEVCRKHGYGQNEMIVSGCTRDDYDQLLQLIGYSVDGAPLSDACRARVPEFDSGACIEPTFTEGFLAGYKQAKRDAAAAIEDLEAQ